MVHFNLQKDLNYSNKLKLIVKWDRFLEEIKILLYYQIL